MRPDASFVPRRGHGTRRVAGDIGFVSWVEQFTRERYTGATENVFCPDSLGAFDKKGDLAFGIWLTTPDSDTILSHQVFDLKARPAAAARNCKAVHGSMRQPAEPTVKWIEKIG